MYGLEIVTIHHYHFSGGRGCVLAIFTLTTYIFNVSNGSNYAQKVISVLFIHPKCFFYVHFPAHVLHYSLVIKHCTKNVTDIGPKLPYILGARLHVLLLRETGTQTAADRHQSDETDLPSSSALFWSCVILSVAGPACSPPCPKSAEVKRIAVTTWTSHFIILQRGVKHGVISLCRIDHEDISWQEDISGVSV